MGTSDIQGEIVLDYGSEMCDNETDDGKTNNKDRRCKMAHYVISDIHGEADRFLAMLEKIRFSPDDTLYILGDVIDRGPDGIRLLQEIMRTPNMVMLLGNHEHMCLDYLKQDPDPIDIRRWDKNGNRPTLDAYLRLRTEEQQEILRFLRSLPVHLDVTVNGRRFYLVHGFPGENVHDEVWFRPALDTPNPMPDCQLIIGHTPVLSLIRPKEERVGYIMELEGRGEHLRVCHAPGFIDIDCGCGHSYQIKSLACILLEDMLEFYA